MSDLAKQIARILQDSFLSDSKASTQSGASFAVKLLERLPREQRQNLLRELQKTHPEIYQRISRAVS